MSNIGIWNSITRTVGSVATAAEAVGATIDAAASSVDLLSSFITKAKREQALTHKQQHKDFLDDLINEAGINRAKKLTAMEKEIQADPQLQTHFTNCVSEYKTLFAAELNPQHP